MLEDIRGMLFISNSRHTAELSAAQADKTLQVMLHRKISEHRKEYTDANYRGVNQV